VALKSSGKGTLEDSFSHNRFLGGLWVMGAYQSPTLGAHTHAHALPCLPMPMGFGWAWVRYYCSWVGIGFVHSCIHLQIGVKLLGCMEYANQEVPRVEANDSERPFICLIQPRLGVCG
jgi:hypothetical protein